MTMKIKMVSCLLFVMALTAGVLTGGNVWAHGGKLKVTGSYDVLFLKFDFLTASDGFLIFDVEVQGQFELTIGDVFRTGIVTFPSILRLADDETLTGSAIGAAAWVFDDGTNCVGFLGGPVLPTGVVTKGKFECSDGTILRLKITDTEVVPAVSIKADIKGSLRTKKDADDDDSSDDE